MSDLIVNLTQKILRLADTRQQPFIVLKNPKQEVPRTEEGMDVKDPGPGRPLPCPGRPLPCPGRPLPYVATIGNAVFEFYGFYEEDLLEMYASLRSQLEAEEARLAMDKIRLKEAYNAGFVEASKLHAKNP